MNPTAIKKMEIINSLSHVPDDSLDTIKSCIDAMISEADIPKPRKGSLKGIWKGKGFERIVDTEKEECISKKNIS